MAGDLALMRQMKRIKTGKCETDDLADTVDGATGDSNIANKFKEVPLHVKFTIVCQTRLPWNWLRQD